MGATRRLQDAVGEVAGLDRAGWSGVARSEELVELLAARERLDAVILQATGQWERTKSWELDGARLPVAWLAQRAPLTRQEASALMRTARHVARFEATGTALDVGDITASHATSAAQAAKHREERYRDHEDVILDAARTLPASGFRQVMAYWRACADDATPDEPDADDTDSLDITTTFAGVGHLDGRSDPVAVTTLIDRLDALEPPDPTDGPPTPRGRGPDETAERAPRGAQPAGRMIDWYSV